MKLQTILTKFISYLIYAVIALAASAVFVMVVAWIIKLTRWVVGI